MKALLAVAITIAVLLASEAFAYPYCPGGNVKNGQLVCASTDDNQ
jgi:hypothetical protein